MSNQLHKITPHKHRGRYYNHIRERKHPFFIPSVGMIFECLWNTTKRETIDTAAWSTPAEPHADTHEISLTWIGHSTFLIRARGLTILTDPVFGHLPFFKRMLPPGISLEQLPTIDYVVISHNHRDHMDETALTFFKQSHTHILVPQGDKEWFLRRGFKKVSEYTWWEQEVINHKPTRNTGLIEETSDSDSIPLTFTFLPAYHWSQRGLFDFNKSLWGSWMITIDGVNLYFAGDTAYSPHFGSIAKEFPVISHALMPIGPCEPRRWMSYSHVSAEEAGQAFLDLNASHFVPMHWGTFSFGTDYHQAPYERLMAWWQEQAMPETKKLTVLKVGQRINVSSELIQPMSSKIITGELNP